MAVEHRAQASDPRPSRQWLQRLAQRFGIDEVETIRLVDCPFELPIGDACREIHKDRYEIGHRNPIDTATVLGAQVGAAVGPNP